MGALIGLVFGLGAMFIVIGASGTHRSPKSSRLRSLLDRAGLPKLTPAGLVGASALLGFAAAFTVLVFTAVPVVAVIAFVVGVYAPTALLRRRAAQRDRQLRACWPDVVDGLVSAVRAGMSLPEAVADVARSGPIPLRPAFAACAAEHHATGSLAAALDSLESNLADPVADRVIAALRIAREVGGSDLGTVLRTLAQMLRADARMRDEISGRQSWTVSAARLAVAAPWLTLAVLCLRPESITAYRTTGGAIVIIAAAVLSFVAYRLMVSLAKLPDEARLVQA